MSMGWELMTCKRMTQIWAVLIPPNAVGGDCVFNRPKTQVTCLQLEAPYWHEAQVIDFVL